MLGSAFSFFAMPLLVFQLTHSALNLALTTFTWALPHLLFGLVVGTAAGVLDWAGGTNPYLAVEHAAASFAGVLALLLAIYYFVTR